MQDRTSVEFPRTVSEGDLSVCIRPVAPGDRDRIREGIAALSPETSYRRFFRPRFTPDDDDLDYLSDVDGEDHLALGAIDCLDAERPGVGVARCIRLTETPDAAEMAVAVRDDYQRLGIGSLLLASLHMEAERHDIRRFRGYILVENDAFLRYLLSLGATIASIEDAIAVLDIPVVGCSEDLPSRAHKRASWAWKAVGRAASQRCCD